MNSETTQKYFYLANWRLLLQHLLGWNEARFHQWLSSAKFAADLDDENDWVYHYPPAEWVIPEVIRHYVRHPLSDADYAGLRQRVLETLQDECDDFSAMSDWDKLTIRVRKVIRDYTDRLQHTQSRNTTQTRLVPLPPTPKLTGL